MYDGCQWYGKVMCFVQCLFGLGFCLQLVYRSDVQDVVFELLIEVVDFEDLFESLVLGYVVKFDCYWVVDVWLNDDVEIGDVGN